MSPSAELIRKCFLSPGVYENQLEVTNRQGQVAYWAAFIQENQLAKRSFIEFHITVSVTFHDSWDPEQTLLVLVNLYGRPSKEFCWLAMNALNHDMGIFFLS